MCQVTSNNFGDPEAIPIDAADFTSGGPRLVSHGRPGKLFTPNASLIVRSLGTLAPDSFERILMAVADLFRPANPDA